MHYEAKEKSGLKIAGAVFLLGAGVFTILLNYGGLDPASPSYPVLGGALAALFIALGLLLAAEVADRSVVVRADAGGVYYRRFSTDTIPWEEIVGLTRLTLNGVRFVSLKLRDRKAFAPPKFTQRLFGLIGTKRYGDVTINGLHLTRPADDLLAVILHYRPQLAGMPAI